MRKYVIRREIGRVRLYRYSGLHNPRREEITPTASLAVHSHSPDGFEIGYEGSGPAQLSLAILLDFFNGCMFPDDVDAPAWIRDNAHDNYHEFKRHAIARLEVSEGEEVTLTAGEIEKWLHGERAANQSPFQEVRHQVERRELLSRK